MTKFEEVYVLRGHKGRVWSASWHPKNNAIASCGEDKTIRIWEKNGKEFYTKTILSDGHSRTIRSVAWSPCGQYLASGSFDAKIAIWSKSSDEFECNATLEGHENEVKCVSWSKQGTLLATCSRDKSVWVWEVAADDEFECAAVLNAHTQDVKKVVWHPNDDIVASASYDNTVKMFKENHLDHDWECIATLSSHTSTVWSICFNDKGDRLASCSDDRTVKIWQAYYPGNDENIATINNDPTWKCVCTLSGYHTLSIYDISWCKLSGLLATACGDDTIRIFKEDENSEKSSPTFSLIHSEIKAHAEDVNTIIWNPLIKGQLLSTSDDGFIKIWNFTE